MLIYFIVCSLGEAELLEIETDDKVREVVYNQFCGGCGWVSGRGLGSWVRGKHAHTRTRIRARAHTHTALSLSHTPTKEAVLRKQQEQGNGQPRQRIGVTRSS
jgi:hypothetical protein